MPGRLAAFVYLNDEHGAMHRFGPDDDVPQWAAAKITNPKAWAEQPEPVPADPTPADTSTATTTTSGMPPRTGQGSGREVWAAYAAVRRVEVPASATRDQIIAAVEAAAEQG